MQKQNVEEKERTVHKEDTHTHKISEEKNIKMTRKLQAVWAKSRDEDRKWNEKPMKNAYTFTMFFRSSKSFWKYKHIRSCLSRSHLYTKFFEDTGGSV